jgi:hypothetical protein
MSQGLLSTGEKYLILPTLCSVNIGSGVEGTDALFTLASNGHRSFSFSFLSSTMYYSHFTTAVSNLEGSLHDTVATSWRQGTIMIKRGAG